MTTSGEDAYLVMSMIEAGQVERAVELSTVYEPESGSIHLVLHLEAHPGDIDEAGEVIPVSISGPQAATLGRSLSAIASRSGLTNGE